MKAHPTMAWTWTTNDREELMRHMAINSPPLIFCSRLKHFEEAAMALSSRGLQPIIVPITELRSNPNAVSAAVRLAHRNHGTAVLVGKGLIHGWHCNAMRCAVIWDSEGWTDPEMAQAGGRIRHANVGFTRTYIFTKS